MCILFSIHQNSSYAWTLSPPKKAVGLKSITYSPGLPYPEKIHLAHSQAELGLSYVWPKLSALKASALNRSVTTLNDLLANALFAHYSPLLFLAHAFRICFSVRILDAFGHSSVTFSILHIFSEICASQEQGPLFLQCSFLNNLRNAPAFDGVIVKCY